jgi:hypothetical protein
MNVEPSSIAWRDAAGARLMAGAWNEYYAALCHGDFVASTFAEWLAGYWEDDLDRPVGEPDARSPYAAGGRGIDWFEQHGCVSGHIRGQRGGYLVPRAAIVHHLWSPAMAPAA